MRARLSRRHRPHPACNRAYLIQVEGRIPCVFSPVGYSARHANYQVSQESAPLLGAEACLQCPPASRSPRCDKSGLQSDRGRQAFRRRSTHARCLPGDRQSFQARCHQSEYRSAQEVAPHGCAQEGSVKESSSKKPATAGFFDLCPWQESNPHYILRKDASYPLNDRGVTGKAHVVVQSQVVVSLFVPNCQGR